MSNSGQVDHHVDTLKQRHPITTSGRHRQAALPQLIGDTDLAEGRLFNGKGDDGILDLGRHAVLQHWLLAADLLQRQFAALVVKLLEPVEAIPAIAHHLAGLDDIAKLLGELQQSNLGADDLLFGRHGVLKCAEGTGHRCQIKF